MKQIMRRMLSVLLVLAMLAGYCLPSMASVQAADSVHTVHVTLTSQKEGRFLFTPQISAEVSADLSDRYGFSGDGATVSLLDVLIRAHELAYGDAFTADTVGNYLTIGKNSSGKDVVTRMFGIEGSYYDFDFAVNGVLPGEEYPCGQNIDFYPITSIHMVDNDVVEFFVRQADDGRDKYSWLEQGGKYVPDLTVEAGRATAVKVKGFEYFRDANRYGTASRLKEDGEPLAGVRLATVDLTTGTVTPLAGAVTDDAGTAELNFAQTGVYYVVVLPGEGDGALPVITTLTRVTVAESVGEIEAPESITIVPDDSKIVEAVTSYSTYNCFMCTTKNGSKLAFTALDQNGDETPVYWTCSSNYLKFEDSTEGVATVSNATNYTSTATVTAASRVEGCDVRATYAVTVFPALTANEELTVAIDPETGRPGSASLSVYAGNYLSYKLVDYSVEDESIVSLTESYSSLTVTAKKPGTTTITIRDKNDRNNEAKVPVTVTGIIVSADGAAGNAETYVGGSLQLSAVAGDPDADFTWTSADPAIAGVDENGVVTGAAAGSTTVYAEDGKGNRGGIRIGVKKSADTAVLRNLVLSSASSFYTDETFGTALSSSSGYEKDYNEGRYILSGHWYDCFGDIDETYYVRSNTDAIALYPFFDSTVRTEFYRDGELMENGVTGSQTKIPLHTLDNHIIVKVISNADENIYTEYKFTVSRARSEINTVSAMTVQPEGRSLYQAMTYLDKAEGTLFQLKDGELSQSSWGGYNTGITSSVSSYRTFVYGDVDSFAVNLTASDAAGGHVRYAVGESSAFTEGNVALLTDNLSFDGNGKVLLTVQSVSDLTYAQREEADEDPWTDESVKIYTLEICRLNVQPDELCPDSVQLGEGCTMMTPGYRKELPTLPILIDEEVTDVEMTVGLTESAEVYFGSSSYSLISDANKQKTENGVCSIQVTGLVSSYGNSRYMAVTKYVDGNLIKNTYTVKFEKLSGAEGREGLPDRVTDYINVGSRATNDSSSAEFNGLYPEYTLKQAGAYAVGASLGSFGGHITYYYEEPIMNDPANPYGIDFTVFGRSPGGKANTSSVYVSEDGERWYELAGSEHYDSNAVWNYQISYAQEGNQAIFSDNHGRAASTGNAYPRAEYYPLYQGDMSFGGTLLLGENGWNYEKEDVSVTSAAWGYAGMQKSGSITSGTPIARQAGNPYVENNDGYGTGYDLAWAVDEKGKPVPISEVHYVKIASDSMIKASSNESGSRVAFVVKNSAGNGEPVGHTAAPASIWVGDTSIRLADGKYNYSVINPGQEFTVSVEASENANVYINNQRTVSRTYDAAHPFDFDKGILRIVVQEGEAEPVIYYIRLLQRAEKTAVIYTGNMRGDIDLLAKMAAVKSAYEEQDMEVYLIDAGNYLQGSKYTSYDLGGTFVEMMAKAGYDEAAIGRYDLQFGDGTTGTIAHGDAYVYGSLGTYAKRYGLGLLSANLNGRGLPTYVEGCTGNIIHDGSSKVGIFGVTSEEVLTNTVLYDVQADAADAAAAEQIAALQGEGCSFIIGLSNAGLTSAEGAVMLDIPEDAGFKAGVLVLNNQTGEVISNEDITEDILSGEALTDALVKEQTDQYKATVEKTYTSENTAISTVTLNGDQLDVRRKETTLGNLWTDALQWFASSGMINRYFSEDDAANGNNRIRVADSRIVAVWNGGNLRSYLNQGTVIDTDVYRVLPYPNSVAVAYLTGAQLRELLVSASQKITDENSADPGFMQVAGIEYTIDADREYPQGEQYRSYYKALSLERVRITKVNGQAFDENAMYAVLTSNANYNGMDSCYVMLDKSMDTPYVSTITTAKVRDVVLMYIQNKLGGVIDSRYGETEGRITINFDSVLKEAKAAARAELETYKNEAEYRDEQKAELSEAIAAGQAAIDGAADVETVNEALANAKAVMDAVKTDAQLTEEEKWASLEGAKTAAKAELETYKDVEDYREAQKAELLEAIAAGQAAIDGAADVEAVKEALAGAKIVMDAVKTDAQLTEEERQATLEEAKAALEAAKTAAKAELQAYKNEKDYRAEQKVELLKAIAAGLDTLDKAADVEAVKEALAGAKAVMDAVKTDAQLTEEEKQEDTLPVTGSTVRVGRLVYKVTASSASKKTVSVTKAYKKIYKKLTIPASIKISGYTYEVTAVGTKALSRNKKLTQITIGANITKIGKQAFNGCAKLKKVIIKSAKLKSVGKNAFAKIKANAKVYVPRKKLAAYKKMLKKSKSGKNVQVVKK